MLKNKKKYLKLFNLNYKTKGWFYATMSWTLLFSIYNSCQVTYISYRFLEKLPKYHDFSCEIRKKWGATK